MRKNWIKFVIAVFLFAFVACSENVEPDFVFAPEVPKAGETVKFWNISTGDKDWSLRSSNWDFGDGSKSILKDSTSHIFKQAGIYTVTLMVDSNSYFTIKKNITVYDSIPSVYMNVDSVEYYQDVTFSVLVYNPKARAMTYSWKFSDNAVSDSLVDGVSTASTVKVYFKKRNVNENINLKITVGDSVYNVSRTVFVNDIKVRSLKMAQRNGSILSQRIFENDLEDYVALPVSSGRHPFNLSVYGNDLFVFDAGTNIAYNSNWADDTSGDGTIRKVNLNDNTVTEIVNNAGKSSHFGFYNGYVDANYIYWSDYSEFLYRTSRTSVIGGFTWNGSADAQTSLSYYLVKTDRLGYYGNGLAKNQVSGGVYFYDNVYFWAKGGSGRGIYRFLESDILGENAGASAVVPTLGVILPDYAIRSFSIDHVNRMIYFAVTAPSDKVGLWVSTINGTNPRRIDNAPMDDESMYVTGIVVDNLSNKVYWAYRSPSGLGESYFNENPTHRTGVKQARLATQYGAPGAVEYFAKGIEVYGLALDNVKRY